MIKKVALRLAVAGPVAALAAGCGANPFGPGFSGGLGLFAKIAQAVQKPAAINKEEIGKAGARLVVTTGAAKRLAKSMAAAAPAPGVVNRGIEWRGDTLVYFEDVVDKPDAEDPLRKKTTGHAEVGAGYTGGRITALGQVDLSKVSDIYFWTFIGREQTNKYRGTEICSLQAMVTFSTTALDSFTPGATRLWARNISQRLDMGRDDTTSFTLDSLDAVNHIQFGEGHFLDAHTGEENTGEARPFDYTIRIIHKNAVNPDRPYARCQDNEGIVEFALPWGASGIDSLHFNVHFYPHFRRDGTITDDNGVVRVRFERDEVTGEGGVTYYDTEGKEIGGN